MAAQLRQIRRRISSVQSIGKITRAQELIASSRIVRAQQQMRAAEPYARELTRAVEAVISRSTSVTHPFTEEPRNPSRASMLTQRPSVRRLLPLEIEETEEPSPAGPLPQYEFEPSPDVVLDALMPQYV